MNGIVSYVWYLSVDATILSVYLLKYAARLIAFDRLKTESFLVEVLKITTVATVYWFYGSHMKCDFGRVHGVTKTDNIHL